MNLAALIAESRRRLDDRAAVGNLWTDGDLTGFINDAEREATERAFLIRDDYTSSICQLDRVDGQREYVLDPRVIDVITARVRGARDPLTRQATWDDCYRPGYAGVPCRYAVISRGDTLVLQLDREAPDPTMYPTGTYDPHIDLAVFRRPLVPMESPDDDSPEIGSQYHMSLIHWVQFLAYSTRDSDIGDDEKATANEARFELAFGAKIDANVKRKQLQHRPTVCRPIF